ncbi:beta strand repeat-containing protein [Muricoccus radiodurans]|uniref:beta strand repeat-containing protein n=1 Tax=Muricoccus radiodurans TaxID=2231721 RepID=UPI003CE9DF36
MPQSYRYTLGGDYDPTNSADIIRGGSPLTSFLNPTANVAVASAARFGLFNSPIMYATNNDGTYATIFQSDGTTNLIVGQVGLLLDFSGGTGTAEFYGGIFGDQLTGGVGNDTLTGERGDDILTGGDGVDSLTGGDGDDVLEGGAGGDAFDGGDGIDTVSYEHTGLSGVRVYLDPASVGFLVGDAAGDSFTSIENIRGSSGGDVIVGDANANVIEGGAGADYINGGGGGDTASYEHSSAAVTVNLTTATGSGGDAEGDFNFNAIVNLLGSAHDDNLTGNSEANILNGGAGNDTLTGGAGNDFYYVDSASDQVIEGAGDGYDVVFASGSFTLAAGQEVEQLRVQAGAVGVALTGNERANEIYGASGDDTLNGGDGSDVLIGRGGTDDLTGGAGNDVFYVDTGDAVHEAVGGGFDTVYASASFTLGAGEDVEALRVLAGSAGLALTGNELVNRIYGDAGNDTLNGGGGADILTGNAGADDLTGGAGDDVFYVDGLDTVHEAAGGGFDVVYASANFNLAAGEEVEMLRAVAGSAGLTLTGNDLANQIYGASGADILSGGGGGDVLAGGLGADTLNGGAGVDVLIGGAGADTFMLSIVGADRDVVSDFVSGTDRLWVTANGAGGLLPGVLAAEQFVANGTGLAGDADDRLIYNTVTGQLFFDADGTGSDARIQIATLTGAPTLVASDLSILALA